MEDRTAQRMENEFTFPDGARGWFELSIQPVPDGIFILSNDITERKNLQKAEVAKLAAESANRAKSDFLANMSHELRTPLNSVIGFSEILQDGMFGKLTEKQQEYIGNIQGSGKHLLSLINDILDLSKVEAGKLTAEETWIDTGRVVESSVKLISAQAEKAKIALEVIGADRLPSLYSNERLLRQIFLNLLSNSVKFTPAGGRISVTTAIDRQGRLRIAFQDTGIGMTEKELKIALTPFGQVENAFARNSQGTGLGLPLTKSLTELLGGQMWIDSTPGVGTTVALHFSKQRLRHEQSAATPIQSSQVA